MTQIVDWLKHHWFILGFVGATISSWAVAMNDIENLKKQQDAQQQDSKAIQAIKEKQAVFDERTQRTLDAVQHIQQMMMERGSGG